jgi:hypothetical protein
VKKKNLKYIAILSAVVLLAALGYTWYDNNSKSYTWLTVAVHLQNGDVMMLAPTDYGFFKQPLTVQLQYGTTVIGIDFICNAQPVYTGTISTCVWTTNWQISYDGASKATQTDTLTNQYPASGSSIETSRYNIGASTIESWSPSGVSTHNIQATASVVFTATFSDGTTASKSNSNSGTVQVSVTLAGISTLSVAISYKPLTGTSGF